MEPIRTVGVAGESDPFLPAEKLLIAKLASRDREVRSHEARHLAAAGAMASSVEYAYETGPDGKLYAVEGKVRIRVTPGLTAEKTLAMARQLEAAADAPTDPSDQDMAAAAQARQLEACALQQLATESRSP